MLEESEQRKGEEIAILTESEINEMQQLSIHNRDVVSSYEDFLELLSGYRRLMKCEKLIERWRYELRQNGSIDACNARMSCASELEQAIAEHWGGGEPPNTTNKAGITQPTGCFPISPTAPSSTTEEVVEKAASLLRDNYPETPRYRRIDLAREILALAPKEAVPTGFAAEIAFLKSQNAELAKGTEALVRQLAEAKKKPLA